MNLYDWYYKQVVSPGELSAAFEAADDSLHGMVTTLGIHGLAVGGDVVPTTPTPGLSAVVKGPVLAYDDHGSRISLPDANLAIDLSQDENGAATAIFTPNQERYLGVFIKFVRVMADPRTDGDGNEIMFARLEAADVIVAAGAPAPVGAASRAAFRDEHVLLADVRIITGQTQVTAAHILTDRTQYLFRATSGALDLWGRTFPEIVQKIVDRFAEFMHQMQQQFLSFSSTTNEQFEDFKGTVNNTFNTFQQSVNAEVARLAALIVNTADKIIFSPASGIPSNNVQAAIEYVKNTIPGPTSIPHADQVPFTSTVRIAASNVQAAIQELSDEAFTAIGNIIGSMTSAQLTWNLQQIFASGILVRGFVRVTDSVIWTDANGQLAPKEDWMGIGLETGMRNEQAYATPPQPNWTFINGVNPVWALPITSSAPFRDYILTFSCGKHLWEQQRLRKVRLLIETDQQWTVTVSISRSNEGEFTEIYTNTSLYQPGWQTVVVEPLDEDMRENRYYIKITAKIGAEYVAYPHNLWLRGIWYQFASYGP